MIGVVLLGPGSEARVLGLSVAMRAVLALQAAGVARVLVLGEGAAALALGAMTDARTRVRVEAASEWPAGGALVVAPGVVVDAKAMRALEAAPPETRWDIAGVAVMAHTARAGRALDDLPKGPGAAPSEGVVVLTRNAEDAQFATRALLASLRKPQDGWVSRALNRPVSLAITSLLVWTPIRPNQLSLAILAVGLLGAWLASRGTHASLVFGGVLFQLQSILDGCDGELSRLTFRGSKLGEWLDTIGDDLTNYAFFAGAALGLRAMGLGATPVAIGLAGVIVGIVTSAIEYRYLISIGSGDLLKYPLGFGSDPEPSRAPSAIGRILGAIRPAFKRDFFVLLTMLAAFGGAYTMLTMLVLFLCGALATLGAVVASEVRRAKSARNAT